MTSIKEHKSDSERAASRSFSLRWIQTLLFGIVIFTVLLAISDIPSIIVIFSSMRLDFFLLSLFSAGISYFCITLSYSSLLALIDYKVKLTELTTVTIISTLINYFIATGGVSGYAMRAVLLKKRQIPGTITFSVSLLQGVLTNIAVLYLFILSVILLLHNHTLTGFQILILFIPIFFLLLFIGLVIMLFLSRRWSEFFLQLIERSIRWIEDRLYKGRRDWTDEFHKMKGLYFEAITLFRHKKNSLWLPLLVVTIDWIFSMVCLHLCFVALNIDVSWLIIASIYFIGIFISFAFVATGGLGVMEGGMAAVFVQFGVAWESALAGVLLYRFVYYVLPLLLVIGPYVLFLKKRPGS